MFFDREIILGNFTVRNTDISLNTSKQFTVIWILL